VKRETFNVQWVALVNAFTYAAERVTPESQDVYWEMLKNIPDEKFIAGVRKCLGESKFFPTIAELGDASMPPRTELAPYNPYAYTEPWQVGWQEQLKRLEHNGRILSESEMKLLQDLHDNPTKGKA
jgi:hypothetical protein